MNKKMYWAVKCLFTLFLIVCGFAAYAQTTSVKGVVRDASGAPVIGATVLVKGTTTGTSTDVTGGYAINIPAGVEDPVLEFSSIGYASQEIAVANRSVIDVTLADSAVEMENVVVTALGIKRAEKALSYNVQQIKSDELTTVKDANFMNSLVGKVAGVQINSSAVGTGGAARVVMRGTKSLTKSNNALYVIDGIPMFTPASSGGDSVFSTQPGTDGVADLNPEDIESINMLTGPSAAALYGSAAANGVVIINTKRGQKEKTSVTYSNNTMFSSVYMMPEFQTKYINAPGAVSSWGGESYGHNYDPASFFNTGSNVMNSVTFSTGTEKNQTYASIATTNSKGIVPNNKYDRYNFTIRNTATFAKDKLTLDLGASYIIQHDRNFTAQGQYFNPIPALYLFPRGESFEDIRMYERYDAVRDVYVQYWPYGNDGLSLQNPYWIVNRMVRENTKKRYMANASLKWQVTDWLDLTGRARIDNTNARSTDKRYASTDQIFAGENGAYQDAQSSYNSFYGDVMANIDKSICDVWHISANIGASIDDVRYESLGHGGDLKEKANFFAIHNINYGPKYKPVQSGYHDQTQSIFANVEIGWKSMLYLTASVRNDWASQLAGSDKSSFIYPSVGLSGVISSMTEMPKWIDFLKVRASYSEVGSAFDRFLTKVYYPFQPESNTWGTSSVYPFRNLRPENTRSYEFGLNARLAKHFTLDFTYYRSNTYNQTFNVNLSSSSGYTSAIVQSGNVQNQGIEMALGYNNKWGDFSWSTNYTFTWNENKIKRLANGEVNPVTGEIVEMDRLQVGQMGNLDARIFLKEGGSMGDVYASQALALDYNGDIYVDPQSGTLATRQKETFLGSVLPKANMGWTNTFSWKGLDLNVTVAARLGGICLSGTESELDRYGVSVRSGLLRDQGGVAVNNGTVAARDYIDAITGKSIYYTYDATNVRLQELSLNYQLPQKWFRNKIRMSVGVVAKNLWMIYCKAPFDPEMTTSTTSNYYQGYDYFMLPSQRNIGFSVKLQF